MTDGKGRYRGFCYGDLLPDRWHESRAARSAMNVHIRECPKGEWTWARKVEWHPFEADTYHGWVAASRGQWLNHRVVEVDQ